LGYFGGVRRALALITIAVAACSGPPSSPPDSGEPPDAGPVDSGVPDAGPGVPGCDSPLSIWPTDCGALSWAKSDAGTHPRNHHLTDLAQTNAGAFLYVIGGFNAGAVIAGIDRFQIQPDGTLSPAVADTPMPVAVGGTSGGILNNSVLVVAGGQDGTFRNVSTSHWAPINPDGTIGTWKTGGDIHEKRMHGGAFVHGDTIYVMGGYDDPDVWSDVVKATVDSTGTLSDWVDAGTLPGPLSHFALSGAGDYCYLTGGLNMSALGNPPDLATVWRGHVMANGDLGEWQAMTSLPTGLATHGSFIYGGFLYVAGGVDNSGNEEKAVLRAPIMADHSLGAWDTSTPLPVPRGHVHALPVLGTHVYSAAGAIDAQLDSTGDIQIGTFQ
jgi:hypothetical protein